MGVIPVLKDGVGVVDAPADAEAVKIAEELATKLGPVLDDALADCESDSLADEVIEPAGETELSEVDTMDSIGEIDMIDDVV